MSVNVDAEEKNDLRMQIDANGKCVGSIRNVSWPFG